MKNKGLGKGLRALIPTTPVGTAPEGEILEIPLERIEPGPYQARRDFDPEALEELSASIKAHGVMQPVVVRPLGDDRYQLIIGERRWRAGRLAGLKTIPAVVRQVDDLASSEMMLIENIQREDLNPVEEAEAYRRLVEEFNMKQEEISERVGKSRAYIANALRLLQLPAEIRQLLGRGLLSPGHGKVLLSLDNAGLQLALAREIVAKGLSVRETEQAARRLRESGTRRSASARKKAGREPELVDWEEQLKKALGTRVKIKPGRRGGRIEIEYYSKDELSRLLELFIGEQS